MKTLRTTFEENFKAVPEPWNNKRGFRVRYVYIGLWYVWNLPPGQVRTAKRLIGTACAFSTLIFLAGALLDSPLNQNRYVSLTGMLSVAALIVEIFGTAQFCLAGEKMTNMDLRDIQTKLLLASPAHGILLFGSAAAAVWQLLGRGASTPLDGAVPVCYCLSGLLSTLLFLYFRSLPVRTESNENAKIGLLP